MFYNDSCYLKYKQRFLHTFFISLMYNCRKLKRSLLFLFMRQINEENLNDTGVVLSTVNPSEMGKMFSYNGINVRMRKMNGYILVCLTDFARLFPDKNLSTIINSKEMTDYVNRLSEIKNFISTDLLQIIKGGNVSQQGTWAHQKIALRVAQKLSTDFAIWVDDKIEELLTTGNTSISSRLPNFNNPAEAARAWADEYERNQVLTLENKEAKLQLELKTEQLDESKEWYSIKRWSKENGVNWRNISWRKMKVISYELGYEVKKIFDANYGQVNIYNVNVFKAYFNKCE